MNSCNEVANTVEMFEAHQFKFSTILPFKFISLADLEKIL